MQPEDPSNPYFEMARQFVSQTARHVFLTGKAGTGKTTFLRYIRENCRKRLAVVAPTGVAAINAGGVTIHSFFQLPFGSFLPGAQHSEESEGNYFNRHSLLKHLKLNTAKRELMQELELLIIDEVSMVRADLLDAIDVVLRHVRRQPDKPFGGLQMLFIGDLFQLPPVIKESDWKVLRQYYPGPLFFHAYVLQQAPPLYLELKKIYRQRDEDFIGLLNNLRNNRVLPQDIELLQQYYNPGFKPENKGEYIVLTTHNSKADTINQEELKKLSGRLHTFKASLEGEFNENALPAEKVLQLKEGAQVMFIRNDKGEERRFYNGKTATVSRIDGDHIYVAFPGEEDELLVEKESWKNVRYSYNKESEQVEEKVKGTFVQFPLRLAWAITIHKSQGLTFAKAIIDAGESFAPGQVYVALSRLSSLDGLVLLSPVHESSISTDAQAISFSEREQEEESLHQQLKQAQKEYIHDSLVQVFNWQKLVSQLETFKAGLPDRRIPLQEEAIALASAMLQKAHEQRLVAEKFSRQLEQLIPAAEADAYKHVHERTAAAAAYFIQAIEKELSAPLQAHIGQLKAGAKKPKKYLRDLKALAKLLSAKKYQLEQSKHITEGLMRGGQAAELLDQLEEQRQKVSEGNQEQATSDAPKKKAVKGDSQRTSLQMFRDGMTIGEIAAERELAVSTIESHLASFVTTGEVEPEELLDETRIKVIQQVLEQAEEELTASQVREILGEDFSYGEIKVVLNYQIRLSAQE